MMICLQSFIREIFRTIGKVISKEIVWTALGAISTSAAVIVALWQTVYQNQKKVRILYSESLTYPLGFIDGVHTTDKYITLYISNTGNRKIIIKEYGIILKRNCFWVVIPEKTPLGTVSLPLELDIEMAVSLPWKKSDFIEVLRKECKIADYRRVTFYIRDTSGKVYACKSLKTKRQYLKEFGKEK